MKKLVCEKKYIFWRNLNWWLAIFNLPGI